MNDLYAPPEAELNAPPIRRENQQITHTMVEALNGTRPWVLFLSVLGFLLAGLIGVVSIFIGAMGAMGNSDMGDFGALGVLGALGIAVLYLVMAVVYAIGANYLFQFGNAISKLSSGDQIEAMENALIAQKKFWRFAGILTLAFIVLYLLLFVVLIIGAVAAA